MGDSESGRCKNAIKMCTENKKCSAQKKTERIQLLRYDLLRKDTSFFLNGIFMNVCALRAGAVLSSSSACMQLR